MASNNCVRFPFISTEELPLKDLKTKWKNLRDTFTRITQEYNQPSGSGKKRKKEWTYYRMMGFLKDVHLRKEYDFDSFMFSCSSFLDNNPISNYS